MQPERIGPYVLLGAIGAGGMGEVFRAHDSRLDRLVAVKRIRARGGGSKDGGEEAGAERHERLLSEAKAAARLNHPAIVQVYDVLSDDDEGWIVMEHVEGRTLRELLREGPLEVGRAVALARQIAAGLAEAHGKGIVHRDLKTENVLVSTAGQAKIVDFGIARQLAAGAPEPRERGLLGTYRAMSPEQARGEEVASHSDLFSFGVLLYELLSGVSPFAGEDARETLRAIVEDPHRPLVELVPDLPLELSRLVDHLLQKDPRLRPRSAWEVGEALAELELPGIVAGVPGAAFDTSLTEGLTGPLQAGPDTVVRCLLITDLVDSTSLFGRLSDGAASELGARHDRLARDLLGASGGREIDKTDGFLLLFERPVDAVRFGLAYHEELERLGSELGLELRARVGLHLGEVLLRPNPTGDVVRGAKPVEVEGISKPLTARLASLAQPGQTLLTRGAFDLARRAAAEVGGDRRLRWLAHGPFLFQGLDEPVEVFEVGVAGRAPLSAPPGSEKARSAVAPGDELTLGWRPAPGQGIPRRPSWVLRERLGEGGFGEVWLAESAKTGDLRVFKFCYAADRLRALRREVLLFRLLKETLGHRDDIARVLDWNFDQAPFSVESEYTEGGSLVDWAREQGGIGAVPMQVRLELVAQVADALAAAHSVGVLHKDVKPANVLITRDPEGRPRAVLTDFGIGLVTDRSLLDERGLAAPGLTEMMASAERAGTTGTPLYTAPELLEGKPASVQADVYALGVMLYQVAVGDLSRALAPGWRRQLGDPLLREDVARLADGDPARRPRSASEVAEGLRSLEARREQCRRREEERAAAQRSRRRRRIGAVVAAVGGLFLVVVSVLAMQAWEARHQAEERRRQAEKLISFMLGDLREKLSPLGRLELLDEVGDEALAYFEAIPPAETSDDELFRRSQAMRQIGEVRLARGDPEAAAGAFEESLALARELVAKSPENAEWRLGLGESHFWLGNQRWLRNDHAGALEHFRAYLEIARGLAASEPGRTDWQLELAYAHTNVGLVLKAQRRFEEALAELRPALEIKRRLLAADPADADLRLSLAGSHNAVGSVLEALGDLEGALERYRADLELKRSLLADDPEHGRWLEVTSTSEDYLGRLLAELGRAQEARELLESAAATLGRLTRRDPTNLTWRRTQAAVDRGLAGVLLSLGEVGLARDHLARAGSSLRELLGADPGNVLWRIDLARTESTVAEALLASGDPQGALLAVRAAFESLGAAEQAAGEIAADVGRASVVEGEVWASLGEPAKAREARLRAVETLEPFAAGSRDHRLLAPYALALAHLGRPEEARQIAERLLAQGIVDADLQRLSSEEGRSETIERRRKE